MLKKIFAISCSIFGVLWLAATQFASAITLWPDLHDFWSKNMSGDPWMPWALLCIGAAMLAWVYMPAIRHHFFKAEAMNKKTDGLNQSINISSMSGGSVSPTYNNHFNTIVAPGRVELSDVGVAQLADALRGKQVSAEIIGVDDKSMAIAQRLIARLLAHGVDVGRPRVIGMQIPQPSDPYSVNFSQDGKIAVLTISPNTLP